MNHQSDHGYSTGAVSMRCRACGSHERWCCDGQGNRLSFAQWSTAVDHVICELEGTATNEVTAPYAEMYQRGLSVMQAVDEALR